MTDKSRETMLDELLQLKTATDRRKYLDELCRELPELRAELEQNLSAHERAGKLFGGLAAEGLETLSDSDKLLNSPDCPGIVKSVLGQVLSSDRDDLLISAEQTTKTQELSEGAHIGRYKLLERIGEGGMGIVYMAEQTEPVARRVALKIIKLGMDTYQVVARFEAERQALAMMDHPNIARVLDGGATESGRPYFVMELVRGLPITEYCEKRKSSVAERLELFIQVCHAVQSAHQKGIIHRDLKPSNILVTMDHGDPLPKVIDFGIAKATNQRLTEKTLFTRFSQMIGTPAYMSPEQAEMTSLDVDSRTDVYSLGTLLYELLTGAPPFSQEELMSLGYGEMQRIIREEEPDKPSTRITKTGMDERTRQDQDQAGTSSNAHRRLAQAVQGDLDWITMKCLEKDRRRRYGTPNELAADLQRHLADEPVSAAAPSLGYQLGKFYRKRRTLVRAAAAILLVIILAAIVNGALALRMNSLRRTADALRQSEANERSRAERDRDRALQAEQIAEARSVELTRQLYIADMLTVERAVASEEWKAAREILSRHIPQNGEEDLRGFEWRYYWQQTQGEQADEFQAHERNVHRLAISPDGRLLATGSSDGTTKLWNLQERQLLHTWDGCGTLVNSLSFTADGQKLVIGIRTEHDLSETSFALLVKDVKSYATAWTPPGSWGSATAAPVGSELLILNGSGDGQYHVASPKLVFADLATGQIKTDNPIPAFIGAWSPAMKRLATKSRSGDGEHVEVWTLPERRIEFTIPVPNMRLTHALCFSPDESILAIAGGSRTGSVYVWDISKQSQVAELRGHESQVTNILFHPLHPELLVSCSIDQKIAVWDWRNKKLLYHLRGQASEIQTMAFAPDGTLLSGSRDGRILFWKVTKDSKEEKNFIPGAYTIDEPVYSPSGQLVVLQQWTGIGSTSFISPYSPNFLTRGEFKEADPNTTPPSLRVEMDFQRVRLSEGESMPSEGRNVVMVGREANNEIQVRVYLPTGELMIDRSEKDYADQADELAAYKEKLARYWDQPSLTQEEQVELASATATLDRGKIPVIWQDVVFDATTGAELWKIPKQERTLAFTPDESTLLTLTKDQVFFRAAKTGTLLKTIPFELPIWNANFMSKGHARWFNLSPDGKQIAVTELEPAIRIIDLETGKTVSSLDERLLITRLIYSPDGEDLVCQGRRDFVWSPRTGQQTPLNGTNGIGISWMSVSPDSKTLAGTCEDNAIRFWNLKTGELLQTISGLRENLSKIAFFPDGRSVASIRTREPKIIFWNTKTWKQVAALDRTPSAHNAFGISPNGNTFMVSDRGGTRIWRAPGFVDIDRSLAPPSP